MIKIKHYTIKISEITLIISKGFIFLVLYQEYTSRYVFYELDENNKKISDYKFADTYQDAVENIYQIVNNRII